MQEVNGAESVDQLREQLRGINVEGPWPSHELDHVKATLARLQAANERMAASASQPGHAA